jgi:hypothetical protein
MPKDIISLIPATSIDSSTLTGDFVPINPDGLPYACVTLYLINASTEDVMISIDGVNLYEYVLSGQRIVLYGQLNAAPTNQVAFFARGMIFYASGTAGTGDIYLTGEYLLQ